MQPRSVLIALGAVALLLSAVFLIRTGISPPRLAERDIASALHASVQREADTTFIVTGYLEVLGTVRSSDTQVLLPGLLGLRLGTTRATVRVPGRIAYGFDIAQFTPEMIRIRGDTIEMTVPPVRIFSAEPDLSRLEVETSTGWLRTPVSAQEAERRAVQLLNEALARQGAVHLQSSTQPEVNTARALRRIVEPTVISLGFEQPHFRMFIGEDLMLEP